MGNYSASPSLGSLVHRPRRLLADEPTGNLDPDTAERILTLLRECVKSSGISGILVTHSERVAPSTDRVLRLTARGVKSAITPRRTVEGPENRPAVVVVARPRTTQRAPSPLSTTRIVANRMAKSSSRLWFFT